MKKRKLNMLDDEISNISENVDVDLTTLILRRDIFENFEREREFGLSAKEKIYKITLRTCSSVWYLWKNAGNFAVLVCWAYS